MQFFLKFQDILKKNYYYETEIYESNYESSWLLWIEYRNAGKVTLEAERLPKLPKRTGKEACNHSRSIKFTFKTRAKVFLIMLSNLSTKSVCCHCWQHISLNIGFGYKKTKSNNCNWIFQKKNVHCSLFTYSYCPIKTSCIIFICQIILFYYSIILKIILLLHYFMD